MRRATDGVRLAAPLVLRKTIPLHGGARERVPGTTGLWDRRNKKPTHPRVRRLGLSMGREAIQYVTLAVATKRSSHWKVAPEQKLLALLILVSQ